MASSPSKRRKLSPDDTIPASIPTTPSQILVSREVARTTSGRPSFASPTKASIARHNLQLLTRLSSAGLGDGRLRSTDDDTLQAPEVGPVPQTKSVTDGLDTDTAAPINMNASNMEGEGEEEVETEAVPIRLILTPNAPAAIPEGGGLYAAPRRTPKRTMPKELVNLGRFADTVNATEAAKPNAKGKTVPEPFRSFGLPRSPVVPQIAEAVHPGDPGKEVQPELPLTPVQRGLKDPIVTTPPSGIHNTPSKRHKRGRGTKLKTSLKPPLEPEIEPEKGKLPKRRRVSDYPARHLVPIDRYAETRKIRETLLKEVEQLQKDIAIAERENERQRLDHQSTEPSNPDELVSLLQRWTTELSPKPSSPKPSSIFKAISSFLPFAPRPRSRVVTLPKENPASHLPIIENDQSPCLQLFTPLTYTSTITLLPPTPPMPDAISSSNEIFQKNTVTAKAPSGMFSARLGITVSTTSFSISKLEIEGLDPCAETEFGRWARERVRRRGFLGRDVNAICVAMGRWYEVALRRARFWCTLESELGTEDRRKLSKSRFKTGRKKRKRPGNEEAEEQAEGVDEALEAENSKEMWTRRQLLPQMKRTSVILANDSVELRIEWAIIIDWTGEAESCISASACVPSSWQKEDERGSLAKVPETFDHLVKARGPLAAVRSLVTLLMPS